jgi:hypothetical protein
MPIIFSFNSWITFNGCVNFFLFMNKSTSNTLQEDILSPEAATQLCCFEICLGLECTNAQSNDSLFMQVTADPVSNNQEKVLIPSLTAGLNPILNPIKRRHNFKQFITGCNGNCNKLRINCGMMLGAWMRGAIRLMSENPAAVPVDLFHFDHLLVTHFRPIGMSCLSLHGLFSRILF